VIDERKKRAHLRLYAAAHHARSPPSALLRRCGAAHCAVRGTQTPSKRASRHIRR
jgi:hypothetical protein